MPTADFRLSRDSFGRLVFVAADGTVHAGVLPVRAFPIAAPDAAIALVSRDGHELLWIESLAEVADAARALIEEELASREFMPQIRRIHGVSSFATPSTWRVDTDRGETALVLRGEEDIRRLASGALLIADSHGIQYLIRDLQALDKGSRRILDRFL